MFRRMVRKRCLVRKVVSFCSLSSFHCLSLLLQALLSYRFLGSLDRSCDLLYGPYWDESHSACTYTLLSISPALPPTLSYGPEPRGVDE